MNKNKLAFLVVIFLFAGISAYFIIKNMPSKNKTKADWINNIIKRVIDNPSQSDYDKLLSFEDGYLQAWSNGIDAANQTFTYNGKTYITATGDAKIV